MTTTLSQRPGSSVFRWICSPLILSAFMISVLAFPTVGSAASEDEELPQVGTLSESVAGGRQNKVVANPWGDVAIGGGTVAPISGSVSRIKDDRWMMRVFNNSEDPYQVSLEVEQLRQDGGRAKADFYSYSLKAGEKIERELRASGGVTDIRLNLRNWKNLSKKRKAEGTPSAAQGAPDSAEDTGVVE